MCNKRLFLFGFLSFFRCLVGASAFAQPTEEYLFSPSKIVNSNAATDTGDDHAANLAADGHGTWIAVWSTDDTLGETVGDDFDIVYAVSRNGGGTWSEVVPLNSNAAVDTDDDYYPQLSADGQGNWVVVWVSYEKLDPNDHDRSPDIFYCYSSDNGESWSSPAYMSPILSTGPRNDSPIVANDGNGTWLAAWDSTNNLNDTIGGDEDLLLVRSFNQGRTWSQPAAMNMYAATDVAQDTQVHLATDGSGTWMAAWAVRKGETGSDWDIAISRSTVNGAGWSWPSYVNANPKEDSGQDFAPQVATDGDGHWVIVWQSNDTFEGVLGSDTDILSARSLDNGETWFGWSAVNSTARSDNGSRTGDESPSIACDGRNTWLVCWDSGNWLESTIGSDDDILISKSLDFGVTWSDAIPLNMNAETDTGDDRHVKLVCDSLGRWNVLWLSRDKLGGPLGNDNDRDIFSAQSIFSSVKDEQAVLEFLTNWSQGGGDLNEDGEIDYEDVFFFSYNWSQ